MHEREAPPQGRYPLRSSPVVQLPWRQAFVNTTNFIGIFIFQKIWSFRLAGNVVVSTNKKKQRPRNRRRAMVILARGWIKKIRNFVFILPLFFLVEKEKNLFKTKPLFLCFHSRCDFHAPAVSSSRNWFWTMTVVMELSTRWAFILSRTGRRRDEVYYHDFMIGHLELGIWWCIEQSRP